MFVAFPVTVLTADIGVFVNICKFFAVEIDVTYIAVIIVGLFVLDGIGGGVLWAVQGIVAGYAGVAAGSSVLQGLGVYFFNGTGTGQCKQVAVAGEAPFIWHRLKDVLARGLLIIGAEKVHPCILYTYQSLLSQV